MTNYRPGDVVLIPFPFTDFSTLKQKPAVVLSSGSFNTTHSDIIVAAITSHLTPDIAAEEYHLNQTEQTACGLPKASLIKLGKIVTLDQRLVRKTLGRLPDDSLVKIFDKLRLIFGNH